MSGSARVASRLQQEPIDLNDLLEPLQHDTDGAMALFVGKTRDHHQGRRVERLEYHAYEEMAARELRKVADQAAAQFAITAISLVHRLGVVAIGEASVAVAVVAPHRGAAFDACRFAIDTLKESVPIWKKERFEDGEAWVEGDRIRG
ncbi:hypothetical protein ABI59_05085 [Acidobacteria bacterium Mor1]|nr:hypothetical protein ABI59_05085 [Acidobacteria bacterium Mor1]